MVDDKIILMVNEIRTNKNLLIQLLWKMLCTATLLLANKIALSWEY